MYHQLQFLHHRRLFSERNCPDRDCADVSSSSDIKILGEADLNNRKEIWMKANQAVFVTFAKAVAQSVSKERSRSRYLTWATLI